MEIKIGYIRVSTAEQNTARQEVLMQELGVDMVFIDRASGKNAQRPELARMLEFVRQGDTVVVEAISRFARNTRDLLELVEWLTAKDVEFVSRKESIDTTTPSGKFMLTIFGAVAELEREYILQRQKEGIAIAKANGVYRGRPPTACPDFDRVVTLWQSGEITALEAARRLGISPSTFYRKLKGGKSNDGNGLLCPGLYCVPGHPRGVRHGDPGHCCRGKMILAALVDAFVKGAGVAVAVFLATKRK